MPVKGGWCSENVTVCVRLGFARSGGRGGGVRPGCLSRGVALQKRDGLCQAWFRPLGRPWRRGQTWLSVKGVALQKRNGLCEARFSLAGASYATRSSGV